jgi:predicted DsbA family dithiol-disulfide isomerase
MNKHIRIDFVSDVSCPWCVIGLKSLEAALRRIGGEVTAEMHFQPFELNPQIVAAGEDIAEHLQQKYGAAPEQFERSREALRVRGAGSTSSWASASGFTIHLTPTDCSIGPGLRADSRL